ncbi:MAG TPA: 50S ribosome-binding GTPase [Phycisphaerales bacterium]|nr:50S ribosome-binding GTPase [Phycisphaerales bacterium]
MNPRGVILAVASPPGRSARGIIRITGERAFALLVARIRIHRDEAGRIPRVRCACPARFALGGFDLPILLLLFPGPHSYTGEDAAEIQAPGNPALLDRIMRALLDDARTLGLDARHAEAGEFTARAFFNGRIGLTQAEGVAATIAARSDAELRAAAIMRGGALGTLAHELADQLAGALALVEAGIDFTDQEDVVAISAHALAQRIQPLIARVDAVLARATPMEKIEAIPWVVLTGPPNAGKSTLFNALLGHERAVVSPVAGTTRDVLAEPLHVRTKQGDAEVMLVDLAGADEARSELDALMQTAASEAMTRAELILECAPAKDTLARQRISTSPDVVRVWTKCDLIARCVDESNREGREASSCEDIFVSAKTGAGLDKLRGRIASLLADRAVSLASDSLALAPRHEASLRSAWANLKEAMSLIVPASGDEPRADGLPDAELVASALRAALNDLASLAGDITPDDVLGRIFATFCVGK